MGMRAVERVDLGVPAWWVDGDDEPGEAWLLFRVGIADETLLTRGLTRLALQLARTGVRHHGVDLEVVVQGACSGYHLTGDPDDVAVAITALSRSIVMPPVDQLELARHDLIIRSSVVGPAEGGLAASLHFGASGYGLLGFDDYGLSSLDADAVQTWMQRHLVGANAAMAWSCEPPERWSIALPWGPPVPAPRPVPVAMPTPRYAQDDEVGEWAGLAVRVGEGLAGAAAARMTVRRLREAAGTMLRERRTGVTPRLVSASHPVLDGRTEVWLISCDGRPSEQRSSQLLFDIAWQLADEGTTRRELRTVAADVRAELNDGSSRPRRALHAAISHLLDNQQPPDHRQPDLVADLHPEAVRGAWIDALASAVWLVPRDEDAPEGTGPASDSLVPMPRKGTCHAAVDPADPRTIVLGEFVIAEVTGPDTGCVVPFRACEGLIDLDDGTSMVVGTNGDVIVIDPPAWSDGRSLWAELHERVPPERQVRSAVPIGSVLDFGP
ncbi:MAG: hypothetical protein ACXWBN_01650 [Acidimicrobiales bacterium]